MPFLRSLLPRQRHALAIAAAGLTLTVGAGVTTLAAWTDHEYVWGGLGDTNAVPGGGPRGGIGTSLFDVQQSTDGSTYTDQMSTPGGQITFSTVAASLSPGTTTYGFVSLRTITGSIGGTLSVSPATFPYASTDAGLASTLTYGARTGVGSASCSAAGYTSGTALVPDGTALTTGSGATTFHLAAATSSAPGSAVGVCFAITLPATATTAVSGKTATPVWHFDAISD